MYFTDTDNGSVHRLNFSTGVINTQGGQDAIDISYVQHTNQVVWTSTGNGTVYTANANLSSPQAASYPGPGPALEITAASTPSPFDVSFTAGTFNYAEGSGAQPISGALFDGMAAPNISLLVNDPFTDALDLEFELVAAPSNGGILSINGSPIQLLSLIHI